MYGWTQEKTFFILIFFFKFLFLFQVKRVFVFLRSWSSAAELLLLNRNLLQHLKISYIFFHFDSQFDKKLETVKIILNFFFSSINFFPSKNFNKKAMRTQGWVQVFLLYVFLYSFLFVPRETFSKSRLHRFYRRYQELLRRAKELRSETWHESRKRLWVNANFSPFRVSRELLMGKCDTHNEKSISDILLCELTMSLIWCNVGVGWI